MGDLFASPVTMGLLALNIVTSVIAFSNPRFYNQNVLWIGPMVENREWHRAFTSGFLHVNTLHLIVNMYALYLFGPVVEYVMGGLGFAIVYIVSLLGGSAYAIAQNRTNPEYRAAGASGALSGITLAFCLFAPFAMLYLLGVVPMWGIVFGLAFVAFSYLFSRRADRIIGHEAHLGGALAGVVATLVVRPQTFGDFVSQVAQRLG